MPRLRESTATGVLSAARELVAAGTHPITAIIESANNIAPALILLRRALDRDITSWSNDPAITTDMRVAAFARAISLGEATLSDAEWEHKVKRIRDAVEAFGDLDVAPLAERAAHGE